MKIPETTENVFKLKKKKKQLYSPKNPTKIGPCYEKKKKKKHNYYIKGSQ